MVYTEPRYTKDLDVWIDPVEDNARAVLGALAAFGAPTAGVEPSDLIEPEVFFQIGVDPVRVDIMTSVTGLDFPDAWGRRVDVDFGEVPAPVVCRADLIAAKRASALGAGGMSAASSVRDPRKRYWRHPPWRAFRETCLEVTEAK